MGKPSKDKEESKLDREVADAIKLCKEITDPQKARAKAVYDELTSGLPALQLGDGEDYLNAHERRLNAVIRENLDAYSIYDFLLLCGVQMNSLRESHRKEQFSTAGKTGSTIKHAPSKALKEWAFEQATQEKFKKLEDMELAKQLSALIPLHLASASKSPQRFIYDALRARRSKK